MAKISYKVPNSLDRSILDQEIALVSSAQAQPVPLKVLMFYLASALGLFWVIGATPVKQASFGLIVLVAVWWIGATLYFGYYSKTKELRLQGLPALMNYLDKSQRKVMTRSASNAAGMYTLCGIKSVDPDGRVDFADGTVGRAYAVVGSASILVFEADQRAMLDRVDAFYKKVDTSVEYIWLTTKEPQKVVRQLANLERRNYDLEIRDPELFALLDEQASILTDHVGQRFNSIHQTLIIKADNNEGLRRAHALLMAEVQDSSLMIKSCIELDGAGFAETAKALYAA